MKRTIKCAEDGRPIAVIRPDKTPLALVIARVALAKNDGALLDRLPSEVGKYTLVGWLATTGEIVDGDGRFLGSPKPGDSFVTLNDKDSEEDQA